MVKHAKHLLYIGIVLLMISSTIFIVVFNLPKTIGHISTRDYNEISKVLFTHVYLYANDTLKIRISSTTPVNGTLIVKINFMDDTSVYKVSLKDSTRKIIKFTAKEPGIYGIRLLFPNESKQKYYVNLEAVGGSKDGYVVYYMVYSLLFFIIGVVSLTVHYYASYRVSKTNRAEGSES